MSSELTPLQIARELGRVHQRVSELDDLLDRLAEIVERQEGRLTTLEIEVLDLGDAGPSVN
jgi:hypothetical protein